MGLPPAATGLPAAPRPYVSAPSDDPIIENPHAPFNVVPSNGGLIVKLGVIELGEVRPHSGGRHVEAFWRSRLPGAATEPRPALSIEAGLSRLLENVRDWFAACAHPLPKEQQK